MTRSGAVFPAFRPEIPAFIQAGRGLTDYPTG
jgi:hypothetical protein